MIKTMVRAAQSITLDQRYATKVTREDRCHGQDGSLEKDSLDCCGAFSWSVPHLSVAARKCPVRMARLAHDPFGMLEC